MGILESYDLFSARNGIKEMCRELNSYSVEIGITGENRQTCHEWAVSDFPEARGIKS